MYSTPCTVYTLVALRGVCVVVVEIEIYLFKYKYTQKDEVAQAVLNTKTWWIGSAPSMHRRCSWVKLSTEFWEGKNFIRCVLLTNSLYFDKSK